jgi:hypothetical protein
MPKASSTGPITEKFNIQFVNDQYPCKIRIFDSKGAEIFETTVTDCNDIVIDKVKNKGFYFLKIESEDKSHTKKTIKN